MRKTFAFGCALTLCTLASAAFIVPAAAQHRPDTTRMSCEAARALVQRSGAIVLTTGPGLYDRYVSHRGFCTPSEDTEPAFVRSGDRSQCLVGYTCFEVVQDNDP